MFFVNLQNLGLHKIDVEIRLKGHWTTITSVFYKLGCHCYLYNYCNAFPLESYQEGLVTNHKIQFSVIK